MTAWPLIAGGCGLALTGLVALTHWLAGRADPRPPFAGPNQYTRAPQEAHGTLAPFPDLTRLATPAERDWWLTDAERDDDGPLYSWQTGEFAAIMQDGEPS